MEYTIIIQYKGTNKADIHEFQADDDDKAKEEWRGRLPGYEISNDAQLCYVGWKELIKSW